MTIQSWVDHPVAWATLQQPKAYLATLAPHWADAHEGRDVLQWARSVGKATSSYRHLGFWARSSSFHHQVIFWLSPKSWGEVDIFPYPLGLESPNSFKPPKLHCQISDSIWLNTPLISTLCVDADWLLTCLSQACIAGVMTVLTSAVLGAILGSLLSHHNAPWSVVVVPRQHPTQIAISPISHLRLESSWAL